MSIRRTIITGKEAVSILLADPSAYILEIDEDTMGVSFAENSTLEELLEEQKDVFYVFVE